MKKTLNQTHDSSHTRPLFTLVIDQNGLKRFERIPEDIQLLIARSCNPASKNAIAVSTRHPRVQLELATNSLRRFLLILNPSVPERTRIGLISKLKHMGLVRRKGSPETEELRFAVISEGVSHQPNYFLSAAVQMRKGKVTDLKVSEGFLRI